MADTLTADTKPRLAPTAAKPPAFIDCDLHNELDSIRDLYPYLSKRWRDHLDTYGGHGPNAGWYPRFLDHREESRPPSGRIAGSEVAFTRTDFIEPCNVAYGILNPLGPAGGQLNHELGAALATGQTIEDVESWPERIEAVTREQINEAARAVMIESNSVTGLLLAERPT